MMIVDSHCHVSTCWFEPVEALLFQMDRHGVERAVLVQMMGQFDNAYQTDCVRRYPGRFASVVHLDASKTDADQTLARLAEEGASGVRLWPTTRSPGDDPLAIWRAAGRLGLTVTCLGSSRDFASAEFATVIETLPELPVVIEHLGAANYQIDDAAQTALRRTVYDLARFPNVYVKIHGLGEFSRRAIPVTQPFPFERPIPPLLDHVYASFGPRRMLWGSDYPPVSSREGYGNALRLALEQFEDRSDEDRRLIFGEVAARLFPIRGDRLDL